MKPFFISLILLFTVLMLRPSQTRANCVSVHMISDTIPQSRPTTSADNKPEAPQDGSVLSKTGATIDKEEVIKVVPKSRKQSRPKIIQPAVKVRPTRIIKPRIIKIGL